MANKFTRILQDILLGALMPKGNLADFQHASRLYVDDTFRLAPKTKFLYYVVFNINPDAIADMPFQDQNRLEVNYLVKSAELPKYTLNAEELNQYNRKTRSYTKITYEPVNITFHDDTAGVTNSLWALYYGYYFRDRLNSSSPYEDIYPAAYQNTAFLSKESHPYRYGLDNDSFEPFFRSIQLITMSQQRFTSYLLCNPKILSWSHDSVNQTEGAGILQNQMSIGYDAVIYNAGTVSAGDPAGFAELHYDSTPSPLGAGYGLASIFGSIFSAIGFNSPKSYLSKTRDSNLYYNNQGNRAPYGNDVPSIINPSQNYYYPSSSAGGFQNYNFGAVGALAGAAGGAAAGAVAGIFNSFNQKTDSPDNKVDQGATTGAAERETAVREELNGVPGGRAQDPYGPPAQNPYDYRTEAIRSSGEDAAMTQAVDPMEASLPTAPESSPPVDRTELVDNDPNFNYTPDLTFNG